jgi:hypothetical protein
MSDQPEFSRCTALESAFDAICDALITLEAIRVLAPGDPEFDRHLSQTTELLQRAVAELRAIRAGEGGAKGQSSP